MLFCRNTLRFVCGSALLLVTLCGCKQGDPAYPINGRVEFADGSPVMFGDIELQSATRPVNARGKIQRDGSFKVTTRQSGDGAVLGEHKVVINQVVTNHFNLDVVHDHGDLVHQRYASYATTDLKLTVEAGTNDIVLVVEKRDDQE